MTEAGSAPARWRPTIAHARAVTTGTVLVLVAVLFQRPDALVLAAPLAVAVASAMRGRPTQVPTLLVRVDHRTIREGDATTWRASLGNLVPGTLVSAALGDAVWLARRPAAGSLAIRSDGEVLHPAVEVRATRWGSLEIPAGTVVAAARGGAFAWVSVTAPQSLTVLPAPTSFDPRRPDTTTVGLVGQYRSLRPGEGSEFAAVRPFRMGDRIRRINWTRSLRSEGLVVNATWADQDTHVRLLVDGSEDYGASGGVGGAPSSLDTTVRAAAAIGEYHTQRGDRVSLRSFGGRTVGVPPGTGANHLRRLLGALAQLRGTRASTPRFGIPRVDDSHLVVMLSPLISRDALERAVVLGRSGTDVVVVDCLPDELTTDLDDLGALAWRIRLLQRAEEIRRVRHAGIPVVHWDGAASLDEFLRDVSRRARGPRRVAR